MEPEGRGAMPDVPWHRVWLLCDHDASGAENPVPRAAGRSAPGLPPLHFRVLTCPRTTPCVHVHENSVSSYSTLSKKRKEGNGAG